MSSILGTKFKKKCFTELVELWNELCPLKIYVGPLSPNVTMFGDRAFMEVIKVN